MERKRKRKGERRKGEKWCPKYFPSIILDKLNPSPVARNEVNPPPPSN